MELDTDPKETTMTDRIEWDEPQPPRRCLLTVSAHGCSPRKATPQDLAACGYVPASQVPEIVPGVPPSFDASGNPVVALRKGQREPVGYIYRPMHLHSTAPDAKNYWNDGATRGFVQRHEGSEHDIPVYLAPPAPQGEREDNPICSGCGKPATCIGTSEAGIECCCDECCAHGQEDSSCVPIADVAEWVRKRDDQLRKELAELEQRAESAELGCEIAYHREPTPDEGDTYEFEHHQSMGPVEKSGECHVPAGNWHGHRCTCGKWVWGGGTVCQGCVDAQAVRLAVSDRDAAQSRADAAEKRAYDAHARADQNFKRAEIAESSLRSQAARVEALQPLIDALSKIDAYGDWNTHEQFNIAKAAARARAEREGVRDESEP